MLNTHAPLKTKTVTRSLAKWLNPDILQAKHVTHQLERKWHSTKVPLDKYRFRKQVNKYNSLINSAKHAYYTDLVTSNSGDTKKLWKSLNNILHRNPISVFPERTSADLANKFSNFFVDKITRIRAAFPSSSSVSDLHADSTKVTQQKLSCFTPVSEDDVRKIINESPTKSCQLDPWPTFLVKDCLHILIKPITSIVNMYLY